MRRHNFIPNAGFIRMGQLPPNEFGFPMCQRPDGSLERNVKVSWGTPTSVDVGTQCPPGTRFVGVTHSHPLGVPFPSKTDQRAAIASSSEVMCIVADTPGGRDHVLNCFRIQAAR